MFVFIADISHTIVHNTYYTRIFDDFDFSSHNIITNFKALSKHTDFFDNRKAIIFETTT